MTAILSPFGTGGGVKVYSVANYGADSSGSRDCTAAFTAAWTAALATGGLVYVPPGTYRQNSSVTVNLNGAGAALWLDAGAVIFYYGSGDCLRLYDSSAYGSRDLGFSPGVYGFGVIDGTHSSASAASTGLHLGDIFQAGIYCSIQNFANFTGSINLHLDNQYWYSEQMHGRVYISNGTNNVVFDQTPAGGSAGGQNVTGSFDRCALKIHLNLLYNQNGVALENGAYILHPENMTIYGNTHGGPSAPSSAILRLGSATPAGSADSSLFPNIQGGGLSIGVECDNNGAGSHGPYTIFMLSPGGVNNSSNYIDACTGNLQWAAFGGTSFQNTNGGAINFWGDVVGDTSFSAITGTRMTFNGGFASNNGGTLSGGTIIGDYLVFQNGSTPSGVTGFPRQFAKSSSDQLAYVGGNSGDQNTYDLGRLTKFLTGPASITSVTPATITDGTNSLSSTVGAATYRIRGRIPYSSTAVAGTPLLAFTGPSTSLCSFDSWFQDSTTTLVAPVNNTSLTATMTGPTLTNSTNHVAHINGIVTFSGGGTLALTAAEGTGGDAFTVLTGAFIELEPVG